MTKKKPSALARPVVFISFATRDYDMADALCDRLEQIAGDKVQFFLAPRSLRLGANWPSEVEGHLNAAACVIIVLSDDAISSSWVLFEAGVAHGRGVEVVPIALAGFKVDRQRPPLSFLQTLTITSAEQLNKMLSRVVRAVNREADGVFTEADHAAIVAKAPHRVPKLDTLPLLTRPDIFREATRLVEECHINSIVRGTTAMIQQRESQDKHVRGFVDALARKCGASAKIGGHMQYHVVIGLHRDASDAIPLGVQQAIADRFRLFRRFDALSCLHIRESRDAWSLNLLLIDTDHAVLGFPEGGRSPRLQYGVRISGTQFVAPMVKWYEKSLQKGTRPLRMRDFL